jgi:hypothetical protein
MASVPPSRGPKVWVVAVLVLTLGRRVTVQYMSQACLLRRRPSQTCKVLSRASRSSPAIHSRYSSRFSQSCPTAYSYIARCMEAVRTRRSDMRPSARRSGTRLSLLVLAIINAAKLAMLPPSFDCAQIHLRAVSLPSHTRTRRCCWAHHDGLRCWLYLMCASGALLVNEGALIHWIEDLHSKLVQFPGLRPIETCEAGLKLATTHAASIMPV